MHPLTRLASGSAPVLPRIPLSFTPYQFNVVGSGDATIHNSAHGAERCPLLSQPKRDSGPPAALPVIFLIIFLLCTTYFLYPSKPDPSDVVDYKSLYEGAQVQIQRLAADNLALGNETALYREIYEDVCVRVQHLERENAALDGETSDLQTKLHELRGHLMNAKVSAFWEIARTMDTNMCVPPFPLLHLLMVHHRNFWVGADDMGGGPKFWSYGITNGRYNDNDPLITSVKLLFSNDQAATTVSTEQHRIVGYKVESNRSNNGWWFATGLNEFGEGGSPEVVFKAKDAGNGAWYEVVVSYTDWKLSEERGVVD